MRLRPLKLLSVLFIGLILPRLLLAQSDPFAAPNKGFTSWLPAPNWEQALLSGNGTMGAMVMGQPHNETIILNHAELYMPATAPKPPIDQASRLDEIRSLILAGEYDKAAKIPVAQSLEEGYGGHLWSDPYIPAFDVRLQLDATNVEKYRRMVNFETGEATVVWTDGTGTFQRRVFVSRPDSVIVISLKGSGKINGKFFFDRRPVEWTQWSFINENVETAEASVADQWLSYRSKFKKQWPGSLQGYEGLGRLVVKGGSFRTEGNAIRVDNADEVLLLIRIDANYNYAASKVDALKGTLLQLPDSYEALKARHTAVHGDMFNRIKLRLGEQPRTPLHSETLVQQANEGAVTPAMIEQQFNAARYNIISATGTNPPNLQGIWGGNWQPPWSSDFTHDGNVQVAVSPFLSGNTPELLLAYFNYHDKRMPYYRDNAKKMFGTRGIHVPSHTSTHGWDNHFDPTWCLSLWTGGAGWTASYYYDYWMYTGDKKFLRERAYPFIKEAALFYEDFLTTGTDGKWVFNPSYSPENTPANSNSQASINATMDIMIARQVLRNAIAAARELKVDRQQLAIWQQMLSKMPAYQVGEDGALKEWLWASLKDNHQHRHVSHLYALYDGVDPDFKKDPALMLAARRVVEEHMKHRRKENGGEMVFGLAQMAFVTAHMEDAATTAELINWLARFYWTSGMATLHNPGYLFNMDLSGGYPSVIMRALAHSEPGEVKLLPAKPADWKTGSIKGMLLRGQVQLEELEWEGKRVEVSLRTPVAQKLMLQLPADIVEVSPSDKMHKLERSKDQPRHLYVTLPAEKSVRISFILKE